TSPRSRWENQAAEAESTTNASEGLRPAEVPKFINLNPLEHPVENFEPSQHVKKAVRGHTQLGFFFDNMVTFAYGRERAFLTPEHIVTDSRGRVIVSDPGARAVHVLDGKNSIRIVAGPNRRLRKPAGIAVDAQDNIYVADSERGLVDVYNSQGQFLRYIGQI